MGTNLANHVRLRAANDTPRPSFSGAIAKETDERKRRKRRKEEKRKRKRERERGEANFPVIPITGLRNSLSFLRIVS